MSNRKPAQQARRPAPQPRRAVPVAPPPGFLSAEGASTATEACAVLSEIPHRLGCTDQALGELEGAIEMLTDRLGASVLRSAGPDGAGSVSGQICATPLGGRLSSQEARVRNATDTLRDILDRLEL